MTGSMVMAPARSARVAMQHAGTSRRNVRGKIIAGMVALALAWCGLPVQALAQAGQVPPASAWDAPVALKSSPLLQEKIPEAVRPQLPVFVTGDRIEGQTDLNAVIEGNAELRRGDTVIRADRLDYNVPEDLARAEAMLKGAA